MRRQAFSRCLFSIGRLGIGLLAAALLQSCFTPNGPPPAPLAPPHPASRIQVIEGDTHRRYEFLKTLSTNRCDSPPYDQIMGKNILMEEAHSLGADALVGYVCSQSIVHMESLPGLPSVPELCLQCTGDAVRWY